MLTVESRMSRSAWDSNRGKPPRGPGPGMGSGAAAPSASPATTPAVSVRSTTRAGESPRERGTAWGSAPSAFAVSDVCPARSTGSMGGSSWVLGCDFGRDLLEGGPMRFEGRGEEEELAVLRAARQQEAVLREDSQVVRHGRGVEGGVGGELLVVAGLGLQGAHEPHAR